jgi:hypothetical protein
MRPEAGESREAASDTIFAEDLGPPVISESAVAKPRKSKDRSEDGPETKTNHRSKDESSGGARTKREKGGNTIGSLPGLIIYLICLPVVITDATRGLPDLLAVTTVLNQSL